MIKTPLCDLIGIEYPIFQGGMAWVADGKLAAAVSNAGGLGLVASANADADYMREQVKIAKSLTDKPLGINLMLQNPHSADIAQLAIDEKIAVVTTGAGNPTGYIKDWNAAGIKVIPVVASAALAKMVERAGAAAVVAEGGESGGHIGEMATMPLVPQVVDAVNIPVIAAGGIADGRGIAAALMLGAVGVQIGTRFLVAKECHIHQNYKDRVLKANDTATIVTGRRLGHAVRSLKSPFSRHYAKVEYTDISDEALEQLAVGNLRKAVFDGNQEEGCFLAGQIAGMVNKEQTVAEIIQEMFAEAEQILKGAAKWVK